MIIFSGLGYINSPPLTQSRIRYFPSSLTSLTALGAYRILPVFKTRSCPPCFNPNAAWVTPSIREVPNEGPIAVPGVRSLNVVPKQSGVTTSLFLFFVIILLTGTKIKKLLHLTA